jgi:beta-glucosidase
MTTETAHAAALTTEQKVALTSGADFLSTKALGGVPSVTLVDGPAGVRMQDVTQGADHLGLRPSVPATAFPLPVALAQTWNPALIHRVGAALGIEAQAAGVGVLLGPGINIRRDPRAGRNFEYYSEDPLVTGVLASAYVRGLQSQGVGASLKHFAANNTEHERFRSSSDIDPRPLREIYLRAFQRVVEDAQPWTVMCSYNSINGVPSSQNRWLLTEVLRDDWKFDGAVVSDWGAVDDRVASVRAGLDLEMPAGDGAHDRDLLAAARDGRVGDDALTRAAGRVARLAHRVASAARPDTQWDKDEHHGLAREVAAQGIVLLKNDEGLLPLSRTASIAVIGEFATEPRFQGGGSSRVNATRVDIPLDEMRATAAGATIEYARGFSTASPELNPSLRDEALTVAASSDAAVLFLGVASRQESEGFDRPSIELPADQLELLSAISAAQPATIVVLSHGGVVRLAPLVANARALVDGSLLGQAVGGAVADVLFGIVNPSGKLTETVPERLADLPAHGNFPGDELHVRYGEGVLVGYRSYDARELPVTFPFGHGLSYTSFAYEDVAVESSAAGLSVSVTVRNVGDRAGREVAQVYTSLAESTVTRAPRELKGFGDVWLEAGERKRITIGVRRADLAFWSVAHDGWVVEGGSYTVAVGASSRDIRLSADVTVAGDRISPPLTDGSSLAEVLADPVAGAVFSEIVAGVFGHLAQSEAAADGFDIERMLGSTPIRRFLGSLGGAISPEQLEQILAQANAARD